MAKSRSKSKSKPILDIISGTVLGVTFVNSKAYGKHVRAARGTYTEVDVNEAFKTASKQTVSANLPAKMIKDAIDPYRKDFIHGMLWQRLVSVFRKQYKATGGFDFRELIDFELHPDFPLYRLISYQTQVSYEFLLSQVIVTIEADSHPDFYEPGADSYRVSAIAIYPDIRRKTANTYQIELPAVSLKGEVRPLTFAFPQHTDITLLCLKVEACVKGVPINSYSAKGMKIQCIIEPG